MPLNLNKARQCLDNFEFSKLLIEELGWSQPSSRQTSSVVVKDRQFTCRPLAQLAGVVVLEIETDDGAIADAQSRKAVHKEVSARHHENVLIFIDRQRSQSLWYWAKRQDGKVLPRDHIFMRGQPGDLFLSKLSGIHFDLSDFDLDGNVPLVQVTGRLKENQRARHFCGGQVEGRPSRLPSGGKSKNMFKESETIEFKKSTAELKAAVISIVAMLNKHGRAGNLILR